MTNAPHSLRPIDREFLEAAQSIDPDSTLLAALDLRIDLERSIRPGPAQDREAFAPPSGTLFEQDRKSNGELTALRDWHGRIVP